MTGILRGTGCLGLVAAILLITTGVALAKEGPFGRADSRQGWFLGVVLGEAAGDFGARSGDLEGTSGWSKGGRVVRGRLGVFLRDDLALSGEYGVWRRYGGTPLATGDGATSDAESTSDKPTDRYLGAGVLALSLYPRLDGLSLRAGLGFGRLEVEFEQADQVIYGGEYGLLVVMGAAYELEIAQNLTVAAEADLSRFEAGNALNGTTFQGAVSFRVRLPNGLPRDWF